ncbi:hypothetical protein FA13DRAFT_1107769 [Coprinellus micaceus]|uniref:Uncharacterized protein n=1 Tax=Coprinellus micaceus TaxID=71717 RepID=A0A4Y7RKA7_COPMI|nr:hypothetical protein FA13DRAFT_1107769 [Coprinellus micaceus]
MSLSTFRSVSRRQVVAKGHCERAPCGRLHRGLLRCPLLRVEPWSNERAYLLRHRAFGVVSLLLDGMRCEEWKCLEQLP